MKRLKIDTEECRKRKIKTGSWRTEIESKQFEFEYGEGGWG